jgi:hypothetical protein
VEVGLQRMWRRLKNLFASLGTYADRSPDLSQRRQVNRALHDRAALSPEAWFEQFWQPLNISPQVVNFVYTRLQTYSGLELARVQPSDYLNEDLHLYLVCWSEWEQVLCQDFAHCFGVDLSDRFDIQDFETVKDLVIFLDYQVLPVNQVRRLGNDAGNNLDFSDIL